MATAAPAPSRPKPWIVQFYGSALGKKYAMAISGIVGLGYVFAHMVGNLKIYLGAEDINHSGEWLREGLLYPILPHTAMLRSMRLVLIGAQVVHVHAAYSLTVMNRKARPVGYQSQRDLVVADFAARTMRWTGVIVLLFIGYHLADLTWGFANPDFVRGDVYNNVIASFSRGPVAALYVIANLALGVHLYHGVWSMFQTLGVNNRRFNQYRRALAIGFTVIVVGGNITFPLSVAFGIID